MYPERITSADDIEEHHKNCMACTTMGGAVMVVALLTALSVFTFDMRPRIRLVAISAIVWAVLYFFVLFGDLIVFALVACGQCGLQQAPLPRDQTDTSLSFSS
jgi:hypothetical protein